MDNVVPIFVGLASASGYQVIPNVEVNLNSTVGKLKETIAIVAKCAKEEINLLYNAEILPDDAILQKCDIQRGHIVEAVIMKPEVEPVPRITPDERMCALVRLLHNLMEKKSFQKILIKLHDNQVIDDIVESTPTLVQDPGCVSLLADLRQVTVLYGYPSKIKATNARHPALGHALEKIIDAIRMELESGVSKDVLAEEVRVAGNGALQPISADVVAQSIQDALERARAPRVEAMPQPQQREPGYMDIIRQVLEGTFQMPPGANTGPFSSPIQPTQDAAPAPAAPESMDVTEPDLPTQQNVSQTSGAAPQGDAQVIASIVAQAFASVLDGHPSNKLPEVASLELAAGTNASNVQQPTAMDTEEAGGNNAPAPAAGDEEMARNLQFMREMGLNDEAANREALRSTNGDLHAAVSLMLSRLN